jgi:hypothetical protein
MMKVPFVDLHAQYLSIKPEIDSAIAEVIANSAFIRGPQVAAFEKAWANTLGIKHSVSCANGTDALYITMRGLGVRAAPLRRPGRGRPHDLEPVSARGLVPDGRRHSGRRRADGAQRVKPRHALSKR